MNGVGLLVMPTSTSPSSTSTQRRKVIPTIRIRVHKQSVTALIPFPPRFPKDGAIEMFSGEHWLFIARDRLGLPLGSKPCKGVCLSGCCHLTLVSMAL